MVILTVTVFLYVLEKARVKTISVSNGPLCVICGLFLGILSSFLGIGGGPINIMKSNDQARMLQALAFEKQTRTNTQTARTQSEGTLSDGNAR